ncbi:hypothetical protein [Bartonella sp. AR 15-3]|uniref:hypothetical protein n=1 Tax=Bartonella sp. AR 15-3 TaxID=545617 RepID=UPI0001F4CABD|nr:hypothetical protein [Bartonella sp. AR 15-3]OPB31297.1 hypothetical protein BAR153v2_002390 [Bartonella sp. AR 15-3]CBI79669.1 conserved hypothetical protein [Bartonella sp. AR 15-3]
MPTPHYTHAFMIEAATKEEFKKGLLNSKALFSYFSGEFGGIFCNSGSRKKTDDAVAKRDIGALAYKD